MVSRHGSSWLFRPATLPAGIFALAFLLSCQGRVARSSEVPSVEEIPPSDKAYAAVIRMTGQLTYDPDSVIIKVGDSILWRNTSPLVHTVAADSVLAAREADVELPPGAAPIYSGNIRPDETWSYRFTVPGRYRYFSVPHEIAGMVGTVVVRP